MNLNPNEPAFPTEAPPHETQPYKGLTKREYFAAMALQGIMAREIHSDYMRKATDAVNHADALIVELNKKGKQQ